MMSSSSEARRRKKDKDPDRDRDRDRSSPKSKDKDRDRDRHKSSKSSSSRSSRKTRSHSSREDDGERLEKRSSKHKMAVVPEMDRRGSFDSRNGSRSSLSYPTFSKTHSKENIYSKEELAQRKKNPPTPEATDLGDDPPDGDNDDDATEAPPPPLPTRAPPSPPLTATTGADLRKTASANSMRRKADSVHKEMEGGRRSVESGTRLTPTPEPRFSASRSSIREEMLETDLTSTTESQPSTIRAKSPKAAPPRTQTASPRTRPPPPPPPGRSSTTVKTRSRQASDVTQSTDSDATSILRDNARRHAEASPTNSEVSPASVVDSSPRTPKQHSVLPSVVTAHKERPSTVEIVTDPVSRTQSVDPGYSQSPMTPPPPPPPPAMMDPPRVDYLLQNGGLSRAVPRSLIAAINGAPVPAYSAYASPRMNGPQAYDVQSFFAPLQKVLNEYNSVMDSNGSLAVATGYRSVARRLLDRLEAVFARNISSEHCQCIMCLEDPVSMHEDSAGVNWGEILELVSGRCDLPTWPPFDQSAQAGLGISDLEAPCQRIDVDVPEQYREHYQQQSRKTKVAVQSWLSNQQDTAPEEADEDTLTFAMLTRLEPHRRSLFYALLYGMDKLPNPRMQPIPNQPTPPSISKAALALQRLYRLYSPPRDQLVVMYLIRNPDMHNILATLSAVTKHEWEILISGRFDGFLWSGAENISPGDIPPTDGPQRFASPFSPGPFSRPGSARPGSVRPGSTRPGPAPVQIDEETEIAVLAEVEREIYLGMEAMEDAFEQLHNAAEVVRRRLRERGAALSMVAQVRRGSGLGGPEVRMDTPASMRGLDESEGLDDLRSEIGPDDSASNVSHNRRRKAHRARERRTPAPVEEESEEDLVRERRRSKY
ncbi:hypothetical protein BS50DRAFT_209722 [Corynespora cassiicola Philippines]|uniref:5-Methylcytosine G/T mismatch-specific DNA glycosylase n=1 Tax=Corynespora cassiicola Philippines TaxID=1448308 RepID=A0A2T2N5W8_CORCC|nr:hypothetical protein BS50DRAFT_209722 [Corynespora cassiicola Philippines]